MKSFIIRFLLWLCLDVCLSITSWILFFALIVSPKVRNHDLAYGWLSVCGLLLIILIARFVHAGRAALGNKAVAVGWKILTFILHFLVLAVGAYATCLLIMVLLGVGVSVGEPVG